jgi:hypothetical protein
VGFVTCVERDFSNRSPFVSQLPRRALEPQPSRQLEGSLANHAAEDAMEMKRRQARQARQRLQFQRIVQVARDVFNRGLNGAGIKGASVRLHL